MLTPQKALARDQRKQLEEIPRAASRAVQSGRSVSRAAKESLQRMAAISVESMDGDMESHAERKKTYSRSRVILTNPDFLHTFLLPKRKEFPLLFSGLRFVIVDGPLACKSDALLVRPSFPQNFLLLAQAELHEYLGIFGSHVALVLRRLARVAEAQKEHPTFMTASATMGNPLEHAERVCGKRFVTVTRSGAPMGPKALLFKKPAESRNKRHRGNEGESRRSPYTEAVEALRQLVLKGVRCLCFVQARKLAELVSDQLKARLREESTEAAGRVESYRGGYGPDERSEIEGRLKSGSVLCVVTTRALELGLDVGHVDATLHVGCNPTACGMWQQAGRGGRRSEPSMALVIACDSPLDEHFLHNKGELFSRQPENAVTNPHNVKLLKLHLPCAANEEKLRADGSENRIFGPSYQTALNDLVASNVLLYDGDSRGTYSAMPAVCVDAKFSLRSSGERGSEVRLYEVPPSWSPRQGEGGSFSSGVLLKESVELARARWELHKGAIYSHRGKAYRVLHLDMAAKRAYVTAADPMIVTEANEQRQVVVAGTGEEWRCGMCVAWRGPVTAHFSVTGFEERDFSRWDATSKGVSLAEEDVIKAPAFETEAVRVEAPEEAALAAGQAARDGTFALAFLLGDLAASVALCGEGDVSGAIDMEAPLPAVFLCDNHGGAGICDELAGSLAELLRRAEAALSSCPCEKGCARCICRRGLSFHGRDVKAACLKLVQGCRGSWLPCSDSSLPDGHQNQSSDLEAVAVT